MPVRFAVPLLVLAACSAPAAPPPPVPAHDFVLPATEPVSVPAPDGSAARVLEAEGLDRSALKGIVWRPAAGPPAALADAAALDDAWLALGRSPEEEAPAGSPAGIAELLFQAAGGPRRVLLALDSVGATLDLGARRVRISADALRAKLR